MRTRTDSIASAGTARKPRRDADSNGLGRTTRRLGASPGGAHGGDGRDINGGYGCQNSPSPSSRRKAGNHAPDCRGVHRRPVRQSGQSIERTRKLPSVDRTRFCGQAAGVCSTARPEQITQRCAPSMPSGRSASVIEFFRRGLCSDRRQAQKPMRPDGCLRTRPACLAPKRTPSMPRLP